MSSSEQSQWKKAAGEAAAKLVENGMVLGLGTGSTAEYFLSALAKRIANEGLKITGIPTSEQTAVCARREGIPLSSFAEHLELDFSVDGADEVKLGTLDLIKGQGGALLREKVVAAASKRMVVVADETKLVRELGSLVSVPVEVVQFGWQATEKSLEKIGGRPSLRVGPDKTPFITDGGNYVMDCAFGPISEPNKIARELDHLVGVVEHGLFLGFALEAVIGSREGVKILKRS
jgi:ribose 5-phosphate isomerase A